MSSIEEYVVGRIKELETQNANLQNNLEIAIQENEEVRDDLATILNILYYERYVEDSMEIKGSVNSRWESSETEYARVNAVLEKYHITAGLDKAKKDIQAWMDKQLQLASDEAGEDQHE